MVWVAVRRHRRDAELKRPPRQMPNSGCATAGAQAVPVSCNGPPTARQPLIGEQEGCEDEAKVGKGRAEILGARA